MNITIDSELADWAPPSLVAAHAHAKKHLAENCDDPSFDTYRQKERILVYAVLGTAEEMKKAWATILSKKTLDKNHPRVDDCPLNFAAFLSRILDACMGPSEFELLPPIDQKKFFSETIELALQVAQRYQIWAGISAEDPDVRVRREGKGLPPGWLYAQSFGPIHKSLVQWASYLRKQADSATPILARPSAGNQRLIYFCRKATQLMQNRFGQPLRDVVAAMATSLFGEVVTRERVSQMAPSSKR